MKIELLSEKTIENQKKFSNPLVFHLKTNSKNIELEYVVDDIITGKKKSALITVLPTNF